MLNIAGRELRSLFLSPLAWVVLAVVQAVLAYAFLVQLELFMQWQPRLAALPGAPGVTAMVVSALLRVAGRVLILVVPIMTMRLVSEERRTGTLTLLLSSPVSMTSIVLGKYLGVLVFLGFQVLLILLMPLALLLGGTLDFGLTGAGVLGLVLLLAGCAAAGLFMSTLTTQPVVAAVGTLGLLLGLQLLDWAGTTGNQASALFGYLSLTSHVDALLRGIFDTRDVAYYVLFSIAFLALSVRRLDSLRLHG